MNPIEQVSTRFTLDRNLTVFLTSLASGLPLLLVSTTAQAWLSTLHFSYYSIGLVSLCGLPYSLKFIWAPVLDCIKGFGDIGRRRSALIIVQVVLALLLLGVAYISPVHHPQAFYTLLLLISFCSATQDSVVDAYRTEMTPKQSRSWSATLFMLGYRVGMVISGAIALVIAARFGWSLTYSAIAFLFLFLALLCFLFPRESVSSTTSSDYRKMIVRAVNELRNRPYIYTLVLLIVLYKITDDLVLIMTTPFLIQYLHYSLAVVGSVSKVIGLVALILGSVLGSAGVSRWGLYASLLFFGALQLLACGFFISLSFIGPNFQLMVFSIFFQNLAVGMATIAFITFLMGLCNQKFTATHYALFSAIMSLPRVLLGPIAGLFVMHLGWSLFYIMSFLMGLPSLFLLRYFNKKGLYFE